MTENSLFYHKNPVFSKLTEQDKTQIQRYGEGYKTFLNACKTERDAVRYLAELAEAKGFYPYSRGDKLSPGDKVYQINRGKGLIMAVIGKQPPSSGFHITAAHIDAPRIDIRTVPLYEDDGMAFFKTHYYGGIKKYQWTAMPLALHGVIIKKNGETVQVRIGEEPNDPVFCVTDLLPHLAGEQMKRPAGEIVRGEDLNILVGSRPFRGDEDSESVKLNLLKIMNEKYGIVEADFLSAELEAVPAYPVRDVGFDRSMIGGYGHDDRVCAYPALTALLSLEEPNYTAVTLLADKEETGSEGNTGTDSEFFRYFIADLAAAFDAEPRHVLSESMCLSADVNVAFDPIYPDTVERRNCAVLNRGVVLTKYTGARGKSGTSDASAELMGRFRRIMDAAEVSWQIGELGKVDIGGGGTVAKYIAALNVDTVDLGVPVLSMHAPFEVVSKLDVYQAHKAFSALLNRA